MQLLILSTAARSRVAAMLINLCMVLIFAVLLLEISLKLALVCVFFPLSDDDSDPPRKTLAGAGAQNGSRALKARLTAADASDNSDRASYCILPNLGSLTPQTARQSIANQRMRTQIAGMGPPGAAALRPRSEGLAFLERHVAPYRDFDRS